MAHPSANPMVFRSVSGLSEWKSRADLLGQILNSSEKKVHETGLAFTGVGRFQRDKTVGKTNYATVVEW